MDAKRKEALIIDIVRFFKKYGLFRSVYLFCDGKSYSDFRTDACSEGTGSLCRVYIAPSTYDVTPEYIEYYGEAPQSTPLMTILFEGVGFRELISYGVYTAPVWKISNEALLFIAEKEELLEEYEEEFQDCPILDYTEFESYEEFQEMEAELEEKEILEILREAGSIPCSHRTVKAIEEEFFNIFAPYGIKLRPLGSCWGFVCFEANE